MSNNNNDYNFGPPRNNNLPDDDSDASSVSSQHEPDDDYIFVGPAFDTTAFAALGVSTRATSVAANAAAPAAPTVPNPLPPPFIQPPQPPQQPPVQPPLQPLPPPVQPPPPPQPPTIASDYIPRARNMSTASLSYPNLEYTPITDGDPTITSIDIIYEEATADTAAIASSLGGGNLGHQGLLSKDDKYQKLNPAGGTAYNVPGMPPFPTAASMAAKMAANENMTPSVQLALYEHEKSVVELANRVEMDTRRKLIAAVPPIFLEAFAAEKGKPIGQCTVCEIFDYLYSTYGTVRAPDVAKQVDKLSNSFNAAEPIEKYWATVKGVIAFTKKHDKELTEPFVIDKILSAFERDGQFRDEVKSWRLKDEKTQHKLDAFIKEITAVHRLATITAGKAGYHGANAATATSATNAPTTTATKNLPAGAFELTVAGKKYDACYCSVHGLHNAKKRTGNPHSNEACPEKATNPKWVAGSTFENRLGGSQLIQLGRQDAPAKK
jgi:hypothetical protein